MFKIIKFQKLALLQEENLGRSEEARTSSDDFTEDTTEEIGFSNLEVSSAESCDKKYVMLKTAPNMLICGCMLFQLRQVQFLKQTTTLLGKLKFKI